MNTMKRILLVDDNQEELRMIAGMLGDMEDRWKVESADSGGLALQKMVLHPFDVVVTDFHMPKMTGEELLKQVMLQHPETVRIVLSGFFDPKVTERLVQTAHQYLYKPCSAVELKEAISRAIFLRELLANEELKKLTAQISPLPGLPTLYSELSLELQTAKPNAGEIINIISRDVGLAGKVLQLANSVFLQPAERIIDLDQAVERLGIELIKALVLGLRTFALFEKTKKDDRALRLLWTHSWAVGRLAHQIGEAENFESYSLHQSFTAGLLHDVGRMLFMTRIPKGFAKAAHLQRETGLPLWKAEQNILGCTHAEIGAYLLAMWGLPIPVVEAVAHHHHPSLSSTHTLSALAVVHIADALERESGEGFPSTPIAELDRDYIAQLGVAGRLHAWRQLRAGVPPEPVAAQC
jgi:HD-like signal output (HDOD) protein